MLKQKLKAVWTFSPWTITISSLLLLLNLLCFLRPELGLLNMLEFNRDLIQSGQIHRLITGHFVHCSLEHFVLDIGSFALLGLVFEGFVSRAFSDPLIGKWIYPLTLLASSLLVGASVFLFNPELSIYRGFSGVCSAQFCLILLTLGRNNVSIAKKGCFRLLLICFLSKVFYEVISGELLLPTSQLGNVGLPTPWSHASGCFLGFLTYYLGLLFQSIRSKVKWPDFKEESSHLPFSL